MLYQIDVGPQCCNYKSMLRATFNHKNYSHGALVTHGQRTKTPTICVDCLQRICP